jgi:hypothetical protein
VNRVAAEAVNVFSFIFSSFLILQVGRNPKRGIALRLTTPHVKRRASLGNRGYRIAAIPWRVIIPSWEATAFRCSNGDAQYKVVRVESAKQNDQAVCLSCGSLFYAREGKFALKYFQAGRWPHGATDTSCCCRAIR